MLYKILLISMCIGLSSNILNASEWIIIANSNSSLTSITKKTLNIVYTNKHTKLNKPVCIYRKNLDLKDNKEYKEITSSFLNCVLRRKNATANSFILDQMAKRMRFGSDMVEFIGTWDKLILYVSLNTHSIGYLPKRFITKLPKTVKVLDLK